jgi:hypothetical protein
LGMALQAKISCQYCHVMPSPGKTRSERTDFKNRAALFLKRIIRMHDVKYSHEYLEATSQRHCFRARENLLN